MRIAPVWSNAVLGLVLASCGTVGRGAPSESLPLPQGDFSAEEAGSSVESEETTGPLGGFAKAVTVPPAVALETTGAPEKHVGGQGHQPSAVTPARERLVVNGTVDVITDDVAGLVAAIRGHAAEVGGTVASETVDGNPEHARATVQLRLPPPAVEDFVDWLLARARLERRQIQSTDVTRQWFDRDLAIKNLEITMGRLQELAKRPNAELKDVVEIERR